MAARPVAVAAAGRPYPGETVSGDAWSVDWHQDTCRIAVVDGLGHGPAAAEAAAIATATLAAHPELSPADALALCHRALAGTRGAAISLAHIDSAAARLTFAGVGNVEAMLWLPDGIQRPIAYRGIVGATLPRVRSFDLPLAEAWLLLMHPDGIRNRFELARLRDLAGDEPQALADTVLNDWARPTDDATVVIACPRGHSRTD